MGWGRSWSQERACDAVMVFAFVVGSLRGVEIRGDLKQREGRDETKKGSENVV